MSEAQALPEVTGKMYLYEQPELLTKEKHGDLGLTSTQKPYGFAAKARAVPITIGEIPSAMKNYPLVFMSQERPSLLAITGVYDDVNLFVDDNGNWEDFAYVPAYVRRYPFGVAAEESGERMAVVIDRGYEGLKPGGENPLFENDQMSAQTQAAVEFVKNYERDRQVTDQFAKLLTQHDLIQQQAAHYTPTGANEPIPFAQYSGIHEDQLKGLPDETKLELERQGVLALAYAILMSMGNWRIVLQRRAKRFGLNEQDVFKPLSTN